MNTVRPLFDSFLMERLKIEIYRKIGWKVSTKPDCHKLSEILLNNGYGQLSETTLYRLFFQSDKHKPYKTTLDILCRFLNYQDSLDFISKYENDRKELHLNGIDTIKNRNKSLVYFCIENNSNKILNDFFEETSESSEQFKFELSVSLFDSLLISSKQNSFFKNFANQKYIREYFFEKGHDTKFRIKNYDMAYFNYLESVKKDCDISNFQDFLFGNCVLFRHYFISKQYTKAKEQGDILYKEKIDIEALQNHLFIFPYIRFVCYRIWFLEMNESARFEIENYGFYLLDICKSIKENLGLMEQRILFHTIAETFIYSSLNESFQWKLKDLYKDDFYKNLPETLYNKHLKYSLPYFDENGLLLYRP